MNAGGQEGDQAIRAENNIIAEASEPAHARKQRSRTPPDWLALRQAIPPALYYSLAVASFLTFLLVWAWASHTASIDKIFLPAPQAVWKSALELVADEALWGDIRISFARVTFGFLLSALLAIPVGLKIGSYAAAEAAIQPMTEFIRYIPVPALIPILMVFFGIGEMAKWMLIFIGTYFQLVLMVADEVRRVPYELVQTSQTLGATRREIERLVLWRAAMPGIFDAMRLCNGWAWTYLVVAELVAASEGMGYRILKFSRFLQTPKIWVYLILLGLIGLALDFVFRRLNRRVFHWADTTGR